LEKEVSTKVKKTAVKNIYNCNWNKQKKLFSTNGEKGCEKNA
jgi:hypothetical protein